MPTPLDDAEFCRRVTERFGFDCEPTERTDVYSMSGTGDDGLHRSVIFLAEPINRQAEKFEILATRALNSAASMLRDAVNGKN